MDVINNKSDQELISSLIAETAKAQNELRCAKRDVEKANNRLQFTLAVLNTLQKRHED